jgi:hypothetical protein
MKTIFVFLYSYMEPHAHETLGEREIIREETSQKGNYTLRSISHIFLEYTAGVKIVLFTFQNHSFETGNFPCFHTVTEKRFSTSRHAYCRRFIVIDWGVIRMK